MSESSSIKLARMIIEGDALKLASYSPEIFADAAREGTNPRIVAGLKAARAALLQHVNEADMGSLLGDVKTEVREGLAELDRARDV